MCTKVVKFNITNDLLQSYQSKGNTNCFFCDTLNQMHEQYDIFPILNVINQWDDDKSSPMRHIHHFKCFVCDFDTENFITWKKHIISIEHLSKYHKVNKLYSYSCEACKILFYGPEDLIRQHCTDLHCKKSKLPSVSILMSKLMKNLFTDSKHIYFCAHCKTFSETPLHSYDKQNSNYCKYCHITFLCSTEVLDCHSLSVEHVTLKCIYLIKEAIDCNRLKKHIEVQNTEITNDFKLKRIPSDLPLIILNRFQNISELMPKCKFCNIFVAWSTEKIIEHIFVCTNKGNLTIKEHKTFIKTYDCGLCNYKTRSFSDYNKHVISPIHLIKVHKIDGFYSYFCNICNLYMYSSKILIAKHWKTNHNRNIIELPLISHVLSDNYKYVSNHPECDSIEYCDEQLDSYSDSHFFQCYACKIDFHVSITKYNLHEISSEHIILKYFTPKYSSQVINRKKSNFTDQSSKKNTENGIKLPTLQVNNGQIKKGCNKTIEVFPKKTTVLKTDKLLKNSDKNKSHPVVLSSDNGCSNIYQNDQIELASGLNCSIKDLCVEPISSIINDDEILLNMHDLDLKDMDYNEPIVVHRDSSLENIITPINNIISTPMIDITSSNEINLYELQNSTETDEEYYGKYVTQRLRSINDKSIKIEIKSEIDFLFNNIVPEHK